jgi:glycosyltransferase involved in cell wall biosynthesis
MHVVIIDGDVSYPANSGKRLRTLNLMLQVAKRHRITYVGRCAADSEEARVAPAFFQEHGIAAIIVHQPVPRKSGLAFYARLLANLLSAQPYSVTSHRCGAMESAVRQFHTQLAEKQDAVDVWQLEWAPYLFVVDPSFPGARVVIAHNVDTLIWQRYYENEPSLLKKAFLKTQWHKFRRFEEHAFRQANRVVAVSAEDARLIRAQFGQPNVDVVDNGIDRAYFEGVVGQRDPARILFLGALDWRPNLDAVGLLLDKIFPRVRALEASATLAIVGRHPPAGLIERARQTPGVELLADVPDVRPYLGTSGVMAVPLRIGGGSRLKILEALACGLPVVSTRVGAEGLLLTPGVDYVQAEEDAMADALVDAIRAPGEVQALAQHGRQIVLDTYDWSVLAKKLEAAWERSLRKK